VKAVVQRVSRAAATPGGAIDAGLCILLGVAGGDDPDAAARLAGKIARLRIFPDGEGRFDRSLLDSGGAAELEPVAGVMPPTSAYLVRERSPCADSPGVAEKVGHPTSTDHLGDA
jgi:D-tyrosyl-tRNA(Tyr) deacylase